MKKEEPKKEELKEELKEEEKKEELKKEELKEEEKKEELKKEEENREEEQRKKKEKYKREKEIREKELEKRLSEIVPIKVELPPVIWVHILQFCCNKSLLMMRTISKRINKESQRIARERIENIHPNFFDKFLYPKRNVCYSDPEEEEKQEENEFESNHKCKKEEWWEKADWCFSLSLFDKWKHALSGKREKKFKLMKLNQDAKNVSDITSKVICNITKKSFEISTTWKKLIYTSKYISFQVNQGTKVYSP